VSCVVGLLRTCNIDPEKHVSLLLQLGVRTGTDAITTTSTMNAAGIGDMEERGTKPERTCTATTEPNNTTSALPRC